MKIKDYRGYRMVREGHWMVNIFEVHPDGLIYTGKWAYSFRAAQGVIDTMEPV